MFDWINSCLKNREHLESRNHHIEGAREVYMHMTLLFPKKDFFLWQFLKGREKKMENN